MKKPKGEPRPLPNRMTVSWEIHQVIAVKEVSLTHILPMITMVLEVPRLLANRRQ